MGAFAKQVLKVLKKVIIGILSGVTSIAISTVTNALLLAVLLARFVIMTLLRPLSSAVTFVGETTVNIIAFVRDTVFSILTFVVQTLTSMVLFVLNQFVAVWRLVVTVVSSLLGETCYLLTSAPGRIFDAISDYMLSLQAFSSGGKGLKAVLKAQSTDVSQNVNIMGIISQAVSSFAQTLAYVVVGDEKKLSDGVVPNVVTEVIKALPMTFDLAKLILQETLNISKETLTIAFSSLGELLSMRGVLAGCHGKIT